MTIESHIVRLSVLKQELHHFKNDSSSPLSELWNSLNEKMTLFKKFLVNLKGKLTPTLMKLSQKV